MREHRNGAMGAAGGERPRLENHSGPDFTAAEVINPSEGAFEEQRRLTRALLRKGHRVFSFAYHSPSLAPGNTPYVRTEADLRGFLGRIEQYLEFFTGEVGGRAATPFEVKALAELCNGAPSVTAKEDKQPRCSARA